MHSQQSWHWVDPDEWLHFATRIPTVVWEILCSGQLSGRLQVNSTGKLRVVVSGPVEEFKVQPGLKVDADYVTGVLWAE